MNPPRGNRSIAVAFVTFVASFWFVSSAAALSLGARAPDFDTKQFSAPGGSFKLSRHRGKVVYVDFWASWCGPCKVSFPVLDELAAKYGAEGFLVAGVNQDESPKERDAFLAKFPVKFALLEDDDHDIARSYDVKAMPCGFLVDRKGIVRRVNLGFDASTPARLEADIQLLLKESP